MNKILKRLLTGVLTLATVFTALPTTAVHAAETQYWTESSERVGIVEKVMNDGSIGSTFNEGHMTVEGEDAYCVDINTNFKNGYKTRSDASTCLSDDQIADIALSLEYVKQYTASHSGISSQHAYLLRQLVVWQRLSAHLGWSCDNVRASYDEISKAVQDEVFAGAKAFVAANKGRYDCSSLHSINEIMQILTFILIVSILFFIDELFKSFTTGMWELEQTLKYELRQHTIVKLLIMGLIDMILVFLMSIIVQLHLFLLVHAPDASHTPSDSPVRFPRCRPFSLFEAALPYSFWTYYHKM